MHDRFSPISPIFAVIAVVLTACGGEAPSEPPEVVEQSYTGTLYIRMIREDPDASWKIDRIHGSAVTPIELGDELLGMDGVSIDSSMSPEDVASLRAVDLVVKKPVGHIVFVTEAPGNEIARKERMMEPPAKTMVPLPTGCARCTSTSKCESGQSSGKESCYILPGKDCQEGGKSCTTVSN